MAEIVLFHHAQGRTPGVLHFAERLGDVGHVVHVPDLYDGVTFDDLEAGIAHARAIGFQVACERGVAAARALPAESVYVGMSLGVMPAMSLAQNRPGVLGAVFLHGAVPLGEFGDTWPDGVPLQIHTRRDDPYGDAEEAQKLVDAVPGADLFTYPGEAHLFTDDSLPAYDADATAYVVERMLGLLAGLD